MFLTETMCHICDTAFKNTAGIPSTLVSIVGLIYKAIQIGVPIILIIVGMFDMGKAITQQKEDEIKKAQSLLVKKAIAAGIVFLMFSLVSLLLNIVGGREDNTWNCISDLIHGNCTHENG